MRKLLGIHFYICITNFDEIIFDEETTTGEVNHSIHALDTFFSSIERFGKQVSDSLVVEKITGSRLHLFVIGDLLPTYEVVKTISDYANQLSTFLNTNISKYKTLKPFKINIGVAHGNFYDFEFEVKDYSETTTIGYVANIAAKLQALSDPGNISITEEIFQRLPAEDKQIYRKILEPSIKKYDQDYYYTGNLLSIKSASVIKESEFEVVSDYANKLNLGDIEFSDIRAPLTFRNLSKKLCKRVYGIPVFADVRAFTCQFYEDDSNLEEMANKTQEILETMYCINTNHGGVHVQFQGDRELALYHEIPAQTVNGIKIEKQHCYKAAVLAGMRMIDAVKPFSVHVGVGEDYGKVFATKIGARGEKDNILLGKTLLKADRIEDQHAGEDQIAISIEVYKGLLLEDENLAKQFTKKGDVYISTVGFEDYKRYLSYKQLKDNNSKQNYNGAWGELE